MTKLETSHIAGIGNPPGKMDMKAYLLQKFSPAEREQVYNNNSLLKVSYITAHTQAHKKLFRYWCVFMLVPAPIKSGSLADNLNKCLAICLMTD